MKENSKIYLVYFASDNEEMKYRVFQKLLCESALQNSDITETVAWTSRELSLTGFYKENRILLSSSRGAGYWAWKPFIILQQLIAVQYGDFVVYHDSGSRRKQNYQFQRPIRPILNWCKRNNQGVHPGYCTKHTNSQWTKRDCFYYMGCDTETYWYARQISAGWSIWEKNALSLSIVEEWLGYAIDPRVISDQLNTCGLSDLPGFRDHRHDQSILSNIAVRALPTHRPPNIGYQHRIDEFEREEDVYRNV